ncbi:MAG: molybdopterin containing oxidoreductase [Cyclobacteriaceae bacterium]|nr:MAG: molybdopterin containing oxidoreductase [Cyclobacteriaceae bacterium]
MNVSENIKTWNRRRFVQAAALTGLSSLVPSAVLSGKHLGDLMTANQQIPGKHPDLIILNDRPWNAETPAHLLDQEVTSMDRLFVRNNGLVPEKTDPELWTLEIDGESAIKPQTFTLNQLKSEFQHHSLQLVLECGGNGRSEFDPPAKGNQWTTGAVGAPKWTGIRLKDVLERVGIKDDAVYIGYYGKDRHLSGDPNKVPISRGVPMSKALEDETLIAWAANGEDLPLMHGFPLRLVIGGWPASTSGKWLNRITIRNQIHDGAKMTGQSYRVPCEPVAPGSTVPDEQMCIIESMPVKSIITYPKTGAMVKPGKSIRFSGHAWAGDHSVKSVAYSIDYGVNWSPLAVDPPVNRLSWQHWRGEVKFEKPGYYEFWVRATDDLGSDQPMVLPGWNPRGYLNNACHRVAIKVQS